MSKDSFNKLFPCYDCIDVSDILRIAASKANSMGHGIFNIEHIVWGCMKFCEITGFSNLQRSNYTKLGWYIPAAEYYEKTITLSSINRGKRVIHDDVYLLSRYYKIIFGEYKTELCVNHFYTLILYIQKYKLFDSDYYIPYVNESTMSYDFLTENFNKASARLGQTLQVDSNITRSSLSDAKLIDTALSSSDYAFFHEPLKIDCTTDITFNAKKNKYPKITGRTKELNRLIDILSKMGKNNAVLLGNPGVGKTAIIQALAQRIVTGNIPRSLRYHRIIELNTTEAISGCKYRGDFEQRVSKILSKIEESNEEVILYIDEIHTMVGLGSADGALDMSSMIKPFLLNSNIQVIGTSTYKEYRKLEADKALERRFDTITVNEPDFNETLEILTKMKERFENHYRVNIPTATLESVISLSQRYIPERYLPDKAIDVLDETCSIKVNFNVKNRPKNVEVTPEDVLICISRKKMIPIDHIRTSCDLENLENNLNSKVIGQEHVVEILSKAIRRTQAGLNDENKPFASFMFIGPTGVGKTEIAKTLSDIMFSGRDKMIRFDMSEYQEEHTVSKLIGAPPGYEGYKDAGLLTEQVRRHPYSLVLFDEIEKAHPKIFTLLLQVLDDGILTDSHGEHINFKNTIIILTSNVGVSMISKNITGFIENPSSKKHDIMESVKKAFPPEFINRLDEIVMFNNLSEDNILKIAQLYISDEIVSKLTKKGIHINISNDVINKIAAIGFSPEYGARELKRAIARELKNPLADFLLQNKDVHNISVELVDDRITITSAIALPA